MRTPPEGSADDGVAAVELAEQIVATIRKQNWRLGEPK